jgi:peptidase E
MIRKQLVIGSCDLSPDFTTTDTKPLVGPIGRYILELTKKPRPKLCLIATASGDSPVWIERFYDACSNIDVRASHLQLFKSPNHEDIKNFLLSQDAIWVSGGSTADLLAVWEVHGLIPILHEAWESGVILSGYSAGAVCWSVGGTTDSFGPNPQPFFNNSSFLPYSIGVHNDVEKLRRPLFNKLVIEEKIPGGYVCDEGVSVHFIGTKVHKVISDTKDKFAYYVYKGSNGELKEEKLIPHIIK